MFSLLFRCTFDEVSGFSLISNNQLHSICNIKNACQKESHQRALKCKAKRAISMNRRQFWGKKACKDFQAGLPDFYNVIETQAHPVGSRIVLHPVSQVRWLSTDASFESDHTIKAPWKQINSAARAMSLQLNWGNILEKAHILDHGHEESPPDKIYVFKHPSGGWQAADDKSLEIIIAHALVNELVEAIVVDQGIARTKSVKIDLSKVAKEVAKTQKNTWHGSLLAWPSPSGLSIEEGWSLVSRNGTRAVIKILPEYVMCSRNLETCIWPKVWHFIKIMESNTAEEAIWEKLTPIPVKWNAEAGRWVSGNRHRVMASLICGIPFLGEIRTKQIVSWKYMKSSQGENLKSPGRYWELGHAL